MIIIPAIDLKDGKVVRLKQGRMEDSTVYNNDPVIVAEDWYQLLAVAKTKVFRLHIVDLNGAFEGKPVHAQQIKEMVKCCPGLQIEIGGGIRSLETIKEYLEAGAQYCILGTAAIKNPKLLEEACDEYPGQIILGVDAKNGMVATEGWDQVSRTPAIDLVKSFKGLKIESVVYTDIAKDGMLQGMNVDAMKLMAKESPFPIIASGGFTTVEDIKQFKDKQNKDFPNILGIIAGKALYEGKVNLPEAVIAAE